MNPTDMLSKLVSAKVLLIGVLPTTAAALFIAFLVGAGAPGPLDVVAAWRSTTYSGIAQSIPLIVGIILLAIVVAPLQPLIVSLLTFMKRDNLRVALTAVRTWVLIPEHFEYSRLGDAIEPDSSGAWYGFGRDLALPRLYPLLGDEVRKVVDDRRDQIDFAARVSFTAGVTAAVALFLLLRSGWGLFLALVPAVLAVLAYQAAVRAADGYNEACRVAFDLHRFDLLAALHIDLPLNPTDEVALNQKLTQFWRTADGSGLPDSYEHPS